MKFYFSFIFVIIILLNSCSEENPITHPEMNPDKISFISAGFATREGEQDDMGNNGEPDFDADLAASLGNILEDAFVKDVSILYISQQGVNVSPNFVKDADSNLYTYIYDGNEDASWANGFNFYSIDPEKAISWNSIITNGATQSGYKLFGLYVPFENKLPQNANIFNVQENQSTLVNLKKSNILGAYHATTSRYTPLKFRLYHLTVFLDIYVYIPVYKFDEEKGYTGFMKNAYESAQLLDVNPNFTINWDAIRPSDIYAPLVTLYGNDKTDINLYIHTDEDGNPLVDNQTLTIPDSYIGNIGEGTYQEDVYIYHFSVLFPPQSDTFSNSNFLKFQFKTPGGTVKTYYFNGADQTAPGSNLGMTQGTFQELNLYLSRYGSDALLLKAKKMPWTPAVTEMNITQQTSSN